MKQREALCLYALTVALFCISTPLTAQPFGEPWIYWQNSDEGNRESIDHSDWQEVLNRHVQPDSSGLNLFDYRSALEASASLLDQYIEQMQGIDPRVYSFAEQKAYWINFYNALTVQLILEDYPISSITKLGGLFKFGPWDMEVAEVAGEPLSLNDIEHRILRPLWRDARIHFAVNCASVGCPNLQPIAFTARNSQGLLEFSAFEYLSHPRGASFNTRGRLQLSSIFDWYADDFGSSDTEVLNKLSDYAPEDLAERLVTYGGRIDYEYDWQLNDISAEFR